LELPICADKSETIWVAANVQGSYGTDAYTYDVNGLVKKHRFVSQDGHGSWDGIYSDTYTYNKKNQIESSKSAEKIKRYGGALINAVTSVAIPSIWPGSLRLHIANRTHLRASKHSRRCHVLTLMREESWQTESTTEDS
jgi:hypothetical protein